MKKRKQKQRLFVSILAGLLAAIMLLSLLLSLLPSRARAMSSSEIRAQINELKSVQSEIAGQLSEVQSQRKDNENDILELVKQKNLIDQQISLLYDQIENINQQISAYSLLIADKQDELDEAQEHLNAMKEKYKERIRAMEEDGSVSYWAVLFKANNFSDLLDRLSMIEEIAASDQRRLDEISAVAEEVVSARDELETEKLDLEDVKKDLDAAQLELDAKREEADGIIQELLERSEELKQIYAELEQEKLDLMAEINQMEKEFQQAKHQEWLAASVQASIEASIANSIAQESWEAEHLTTATEPPTTTETKPGETTAPTEAPKPTQPVVTANWLVPCEYRQLSSVFGNREQPTAGASTNHQAVDLAGPEGTPIHASRSGNVIKAAYSNGLGYYVILSHGDGYTSTYAHMTNYTVSYGQYVTAGDVIGYMGRTGIATGNHLHFAIAYNGTPVNPANFMYLHP